MTFVLSNADIFTGHEILTNQSVVINAGRVVNIIDNTAVETFASKHTVKVIDLKGNLLVPGFIDSQVNGGAGVLFNHSPTVESIAHIGRAHRIYGTTGFLPTLISDDAEAMQLAISAARQAFNQKTPGFLGIHLEGPYLNPARKGVHSEAKLRVANSESLILLKQLRGLGSSIVTLAPEMVPDGFIESLIAEGIIVCVGHSNATYNCIQQSLLQGVSGFTHLFNAMSPLTSREPGVVGAAIIDPDSWCGIIVDGHHVHSCALNIAIAAKTKGKMMLVTDAVHTVGAQGNAFDLAGCPVFRDKGKVTTAEGTLAGSDLDMASAVRNTVRMLGIELAEALRMASLYPAQFLGLEHTLGRIKSGYQADLTLLDCDLNVINTWIKGVCNDPANQIL